MIRLDSTLRKLQIILGGAVTTNQLPVTVCYSDKTLSDYAGATQVSLTNGGTAVDICAAPAASTVRDIDTVDVQNADTVPATATILYNDNGTLYTLFKVLLGVGDQLTYTHGQGWRVLDSFGNIKVASNTNGPAFLAYQNIAQAIPMATNTKLQFPVKEFDTNNTFDAVTNYRFTPNVPGYYQVAVKTACATPTQIVVFIAKNGVALKELANVSGAQGAGGFTLVSMNGSTDYIEFFVYFGIGQNTLGSPFYTFCQGFLARSL